MKILNFTFILIVSIFFSEIASATEFHMDDKENKHRNINIIQKPVESTLDIHSVLGSIQAQIDEGHQKADSKLIVRAHKTFKKLKYSTKEWQAAATSLGVIQWPLQKTSRKIVGGHLFYPKNITELLDSPHTERLIQRPDMLRSLEFAADFHHSLGLYYLAYAVDTIRSEATDEEKPSYFKQVYCKALKELEQCQNNPEARYILGRNYTEDTIKTKAFKINPQLGYQIYSEGKDPRNKFAALAMRQEYKGFESPVPQEYEDVAREGYGPAYIKLSYLEHNFDKAVDYLEQAYKLGFYPALVEMGLLYKNNNDIENASRCFEEAGRKGIAEGYMNLGIMKVGRILSREERDGLVKRVSKEDLDAAIFYFQQAGELHYARGSEYLAILYIELFKSTEEKSYIHKIRATLKEGAKLGSMKSYDYILELFRGELKNLGVPVHQELYTKLEKLALK